MNRNERARIQRGDDRRTDDQRANARLKKDRRDLDRRHADVLKKIAFREEILQAAWLEAMLKREIEGAR
jgi:hypothetical protein